MHYFIALDAAAPLFEFPLRMSENRRLARTDADFVDSIHSNVGFFGFLSPFADADFYLNNGGPVQPGCIEINVFESCKFFWSNNNSIIEMIIIDGRLLLHMK